MRLLQSIFLSAIIILSSNTAFAYPDNSNNEPEQYVQVHLIADKTNVKAGDTITVGIDEKIYPNWHTYWQNAGDSGTPLEITWDAPKEFKFSPIKHPIPKIIPYGPLTNYGHEGNIVLLQTLTLPKTIPDGEIKLAADINLLVCHEICIPENHKALLILNGSVAPNLNKIQNAKDKLPKNIALKGKITEDNDSLIINVDIENPNIFKNIDSIDLLPIEWGIIDNTAKTKAQITNTGLQITHKRGERELSEILKFPFVIAYNDQNGTRQGIELSLPTSNNTANNNGNNINFIKALFLAILGGLVLNLMPCVFPVLSMKALSLIKLSDKEEAKAKVYGLSYTVGILISFGIIAGLLITLKSAGAQIGWGFQLQSPIVIIILSYLVFIIGLNLSGFFEFAGRFSHWGQKLTTKSGHNGAFWTGVLATIVATPCTAPFMGAAIGFALTQNAFASMVVFLGLGFGLALPYLLLCYIPALRSKLPKPGVWMETFRQFLSFPMFITAAWLLWVLTQQAANTTVFLTLIGMISITFGLWLLKQTPKKHAIKLLHRMLMGLVIIGLLFPVITAKTNIENNHASTNINQNWEAYSPEKLNDLLESNDPIFVNMTAAWCITCKVNDKVSLSKKSIKELFKNNNVKYLKGDWTNKDAEITKYLTKFNRNGVPLYVYYPSPKDDDSQRPEPILLPQILTPNIVFETISSNGTNK